MRNATPRLTSLSRAPKRLALHGWAFGILRPARVDRSHPSLAAETDSARATRRVSGVPSGTNMAAISSFSRIIRGCDGELPRPPPSFAAD